MTDVRQVDADLMGPTGAQRDPQEITDVKPCQTLRPRFGRPTGREHDHPLPIVGVPPDGFVDVEDVLDMSPDQSRILTLDPTCRQCSAESPVGDVRLGNNQQSRRVTVQPVHDSRPLAVLSGQRRPPGEEGVDQRIVPMARRRVHNHPGGLVDHQQSVVLVRHLQGHRVGPQRAARFLFGKLHGNDVAMK
jgi:hypothetical protein